MNQDLAQRWAAEARANRRARGREEGGLALRDGRACAAADRRPPARPRAEHDASGCGRCARDLLAPWPADPADARPVGCTVKWTLDRPAGSGAEKPVPVTPARDESEAIELLYLTECPSHPQALDLLRRVLPAHGTGPETVVLHKVTTQDDAVACGVVGSPTIRFNGVDIVPTDGEAPALTCRVYRHRNGRYDPLPEEQELHDALRFIRAA